jgi:hypothetical protein
MGYRIVKPGSAVRNGELLEFYSYWERADTVRADLSSLDTTAEEPLGGTYVGDSTVVAADSTQIWRIFWFTHSIGAENARADGGAIGVPITAVAAASGLTTTNEALQFCLRNHPPRHLGSEIIGAAERFVVEDGETLYLLRNGDSLIVETTWSFRATPFSTAADFSAIDANFDAAAVYYQLIDAPAETLQTHRIFYELSDDAQGETTVSLPARIVARDGGCGRDSITFQVRIDNEGPAEGPTLDSLPTAVTTPLLEVTGTGPSDADDILLVVNQTNEFVFDLHAAGDSLVYFGTIALQPGLNQIIAYARDVVGNRSTPSTTRQVTLQYAPQFKGWRLMQPDSLAADTTQVIPVVNGDVLLLHAYWDTRAPYTITADFSDLDSGFDGDAVLVTQIENVTVAVGDSTETWAAYRIEYRITAENTTADGSDIVVPLAAFDPSTGYTATTESLRFCLSNHPPEHIATTFQGNPNRWAEYEGDSLFSVRNDGDVLLLTEWTRAAGGYDVEADFSSMDVDFVTQLVKRSYVDSLSTDSTVVYSVFYSFGVDACCPDGQDPYPLPATITVREREGCGTGTVTLWLAMDNEGPAGSPLVSPEPAAQTTAASLTVSGTAPAGSEDVLVVVDHVDADSVTAVAGVALDTELAFEATVPLLAGTNQLVAYGRDAVGNRSAPSPTAIIWRITDSATLMIPKPFHPGDEFRFEDLSLWSRLRFEIYNLEGDRIRSWHFHGEAGYSFAAAWDGRNGRGVDVRQGPYLLRVERTNAAGRTVEEVKAFVFQR